MKTRFAVAMSACSLLAAGCATKDATSPQTQAGVRIVNAYGQPVDVLVDGALAVAGVPPGVDTVSQSAGNHTVTLRAAGVTTSGVPVTIATGAVATVAAVRWGSVLAAAAFGDTNAVVPSGATKVRVLHLAPNAGEIQVFRTQPDWGTPIEWQFPFLYDSVLTDPLAHPYLQSTVGTWEVRAWRKPSEVGLGWAGTTAHVTFNLASGQKRTVLVLDKAGGGIELSVID